MMKRQTLKTALIFGVMILMAPYLFAYENYGSKSSNPQLSNLKEGKVKILAIAPYPAHYDSIALADRLESEIAAIRTGTAWDVNDFERKTLCWHFLRVTREEMEKDALEALKSEYGIIILGANPVWTAYPESVRHAIIDKVKAGTSLIIFGNPGDFFAEAKKTGGSLKEIDIKINKFSPIKEGRDALREKYYQFSKGSIANLNTQTNERRGYLVTESMSNLYNEYKYRRIANIIYKLSNGIVDGEIKSASVEKAKKSRVETASGEKCQSN